jgi:hypothetical protein
MKIKNIILSIFALGLFLSMTSCTENYANGERIGLITQFSKSGLMWKAYEGHLNLTQTGMNSSSLTPFDFSIDNDNEPADLVNTIDSAAEHGWKVKLTYHETCGKNWFGNRGATDHFIVKCEVLDKNPVKSALGGGNDSVGRAGVIIDTVYFMIVPKEKVML